MGDEKMINDAHRVRSLVDEIVRCDSIEAEHRLDAMAWLDGVDEIFRTAKTATPPKHLVSYCALVDRDARQCSWSTIGKNRTLRTTPIVAGCWGATLRSCRPPSIHLSYLANCKERTLAAIDRKAVENFWKGVDVHDWDLVASTLADDFTRIGMRDDEADTSRTKRDYLDFVSKVTGKMDHHDLKVERILWSEDGRSAVAECIETIRPPGEDELIMRFINVMEINDDGLLSQLDIFWKTPPRMPPAWITPEALKD